MVETVAVGLAWGMVLACGALGCSSDSDKHSNPGSGGGGSSSTAGKGSSTVGGHFAVSGANNSGFPDEDGVYVGTTDDVKTALPVLPQLSNVVARLNDDSVKITFDPFEGALDYRVYELPADDALSPQADGHIEIKNGTYRCAGNREAPPVVVDGAEYIKSDAINTKVDNQMVGNYLRTAPEALMGYVYSGPGPGLVPVYVLGDSDGRADVSCFFARFQASRFKKYTTSDDERTALLADAARDDGIAFYVPAEAGATTKQVSRGNGRRRDRLPAALLLAEGPEAESAPTKPPHFRWRGSPAPTGCR